MEPVVLARPTEVLCLLWLPEQSHFDSELIPGPSSSTFFNYPSGNSYSVQGVSIRFGGGKQLFIKKKKKEEVSAQVVPERLLN